MVSLASRIPTLNKPTYHQTSREIKILCIIALNISQCIIFRVGTRQRKPSHAVKIFCCQNRPAKSLAMFSFRKQDPDEDIPVINIGGIEDVLVSPTLCVKGNTQRRKGALPLPSVHDPIPVITQANLDDHVPQIPLHSEPFIDPGSPNGDPFRFIEAEPVGDHDSRIHDDHHSMSPTLRSALISCSSTTGVMSSD